MSKMNDGLISPIPSCVRCGRLARYSCEECEQPLCDYHAEIHGNLARVGGCDARPDTAVKPTRPLPPSALRTTASIGSDAEQIGNLQARVSRLEGDVKALRADGDDQECTSALTCERIVDTKKEKAMLTVEFPCGIGSEVTIKLTRVVGAVKGWMIDEDGVKMAWVEYADANKAIRSDWIREGELTV